MHSLRLLSAIFPEFAAVDCLVVRDFYHRYTVDEHIFQPSRRSWLCQGRRTNGPALCRAFQRVGAT